jgi:WD40 repeat protein
MGEQWRTIGDHQRKQCSSVARRTARHTATAVDRRDRAEKRLSTQVHLLPMESTRQHQSIGDDRRASCARLGPSIDEVSRIGLLLCIVDDRFASRRCSFAIDNAHSPYVRDVDFNPNRQYHLMTCGDDCRVKFWDVRKPNECLKVLTDHSHWFVLFACCPTVS